MTQVLGGGMRKNDHRTQTWEISTWMVQSEKKENWKGIFKDRITWSNIIELSGRSEFRNEVDNSRKYYGGIMVSAFWGAALPTIPAVCNKHYSFCYMQSSMSKGYLCGHATDTTYSSKGKSK